MERVVRPLLEEASGLKADSDFFLAYCPERVMPGKLLENLRTCNRVIGGTTPRAASLARALYSHFVDADLDLTDALTAELVKATENAYRDVQIAFANEMALLCEVMGADVWQVRELVNKSPYRDMHLPGAGVGGHCIPKDPWLLIANAPADFSARLIPAARAINDGMPGHVADLIVEALREAGADIARARILVLGYAYLENSDDARNSPSMALVERLEALGAQVVIHDPYIAAHRGDPLQQAQDCDAAVLMVRHDEYRGIDLAQLKAQLARPVLVDGRHLFDRGEAAAAGFVFRGVGVG
jgi:UDP-N-acetyl-D-mannosaminuronic acid dehydrogenase